MPLFENLQHRLARYRARRAFYAVELSKDDVAIDCGANVGDITEHLARSGATVYAFEPNPYAFKKLKARFADMPHVHCMAQGVSDRTGRMKLFLHEHSDSDEVLWSTGSSLLQFKGNVRRDKYVEVEVIDLCQFIEALNRRVRLLKMDVEGVECDILQKMIDTRTIQKVDHAFVETHEHQMPELQAQTEALKGLIRREQIRNINLNWT